VLNVPNNYGVPFEFQPAVQIDSDCQTPHQISAGPSVTITDLTLDGSIPGSGAVTFSISETDHFWESTQQPTHLVLYEGTIPPDVTPPNLNLPGTITVNATSSNGATVSYDVNAWDPDNPPSDLTVSCSPASGSVFPIGTTTVNCTASDPAGNTATGSFQVGVIYNWSGFLQPINADGSSIFKQRSTVPVKFQLVGNSAGITNAVANLYIAKIDNNIEGTEMEAVSTSAADSGNTFRYDSTAQQYIFNLGTKSLTTGTYILLVYVGGNNKTGVLQGEINISLK
jgi:hypothetical protein